MIVKFHFLSEVDRGPFGIVVLAIFVDVVVVVVFVVVVVVVVVTIRFVIFGTIDGLLRVGTTTRRVM